MTALPPSPRLRARRWAATAAALALLATGCAGADDAAPAQTSAASDAGGSDQGGATAAAAPEPEPIAATPAPGDYTRPADSCTGEGIHLVEQGGSARPALPTRAGGSLQIGVASLTKDTARLTATVGGEPRPIEEMKVGDTAQVDLWTISVTSICLDQKQVEFDVID